MPSLSSEDFLRLYSTAFKYFNNYSELASFLYKEFQNVDCVSIISKEKKQLYIFSFGKVDIVEEAERLIIDHYLVAQSGLFFAYYKKGKRHMNEIELRELTTPILKAIKDRCDLEAVSTVVA